MKIEKKSQWETSFYYCLEKILCYLTFYVIYIQFYLLFTFKSLSSKTCLAKKTAFKTLGKPVYGIQ
jgi:hypothetical protein